MTHASIYMGITVIVLIFISLRTNPLAAAGSFVHELFHSRKYLFHFLAMLAILFFNKLELSIEARMKQQVDFTPEFFKLEGNIVGWIQQAFQNDTLTGFLTFYYIVIFTSLLIASIAIYTHNKQFHLFYAICYAVMINYMVAIPFYFFFPVNELWYYHPNVEFLIPQFFPTFEQEYRPLSGLNNCFPSLHTSLSVTIAIIAAKSGLRVWKWFTAISACIIIFSIFYLGIHWITDMLGGIALAVVAATVGLRISEDKRVFNEDGQLSLSRNRMNKRNVRL